jgi:hypothetical protein
VVVEEQRLFDPWTRAAAALLAVGPDGVITGVTAARLHGCRAVESADTHVLVPYGHEGESRNGLVIHHGGFFTDAVEVLDGIRVLDITRVTADVLCSSRDQDGLALADEVLRLAGAEHERVRKEIAAQVAARQDPRGTVKAATLLDLASPYSASPAESWFRLRLIDLGFPIPEVNWRLMGLDGELVYKLDLAWPALRIVVEYDGYEAHVGRSEADAARAQDLRKRGWIVIRAAAADLSAPGRVARELREAFRIRGYTW